MSFLADYIDSSVDRNAAAKVTYGGGAVRCSSNNAVERERETKIRPTVVSWKDKGRIFR